jgi:fatty acid desaturase
MQALGRLLPRRAKAVSGRGWRVFPRQAIMNEQVRNTQLLSGQPGPIEADGNGPRAPATHTDYVRTLMPLLPREAFAPNTRKLYVIGLHIAIVLIGVAAFRFVGRPYWPLLSVPIGISMGAMAFLAHDVGHRSVVRDRRLLYLTELAIWGILYIPPTVWRRVHASHHVHTNGHDDPDRRFLREELTPLTSAYAVTFFPNRWLKYSIIYLLHFVAYSLRHTVTAFYPGRIKPGSVTAKPAYSGRDKMWIGLEIGYIAMLHLGLASLAGGATAYCWAVLVPIVMMSAAVSFYFFTNHSLNPLNEDGDILAATTSVVVPRPLNVLHSNFSYHAEHHLFPHMNSDYYPLVGTLIEQNFPASYQRIPVLSAWSQLWKLALAITLRRPSGAQN